MIRVVLPHHLRTLARVGDEIAIQPQGTPSVASVLDALEATYPMLRGTIREHATLKRRPNGSLLCLRRGCLARAAGVSVA